MRDREPSRDAVPREVRAAAGSILRREAVSRTEYGEWLTTQGRAAEAEDLLAQAASTFADLGAGPWLERANSARGTYREQREAATAMPA